MRAGVAMMVVLAACGGSAGSTPDPTLQPIAVTTVRRIQSATRGAISSNGNDAVMLESFERTRLLIASNPR